MLRNLLKNTHLLFISLSSLPLFEKRFGKSNFFHFPFSFCILLIYRGLIYIGCCGSQTSQGLCLCIEIDHGAEEDTIWACRPRKKRWSWNNLGRKTIGFFISWHRNEWIFIPNAKQALNPRTINSETSIPGTIMGFLCALTMNTVPQGFKEPCGLLFLFLSKQN